MEEGGWRAVFSGTFIPVLMLRAKCSLLALKLAHSSRLLPGAPGPDGLYGLYQGQRLAELLRADLDGLISFALNHGVVPMILAEYRRIIAGLNETIQSLPRQAGTFPLVPEAMSLPNSQMQQPDASQIEAVTQVADEADGVLDMFFGGTENSAELVETDPHQ